MANKLADLFVRIFVRKDGSDEAIDQTKAKLKEVGESGNEAGKKIGGGFEDAGKSAERFQSILGKIAIPFGIVTAIAGMVEQLRRGGREIEAFRESLNSLESGAFERFRAVRLNTASDLQRALLDIDKQTARDQERAIANFEAAAEKYNVKFKEYFQSRTLAGATGETKTIIQELTDDLERTLDGISKSGENLKRDLTRQYNEIKAESDRAAESVATSELVAIAEAQRRAALSDVDRAREEFYEVQKRIAAILRGGATPEQEDAVRFADEQARKSLQRALDRQAAEDQAERDRQAEADAKQAERDRKTAEAIERAHERGAERLQRAIEDALGDQFGEFGTGITTLTGLVNRIQTDIRARL